MEFKFNVNKLLPRKINKITHTLIPEDFRGDRREFNECQRQLTRILDEIGEASSKAQGLSKPITSATKMRNSDHTVYILVDNEGNNGLGSVIGLLKVGSKNLFMFDETGIHYQVKPRCILDFYIHESRQRMGLGNLLYQHMLTEENLRPVKLAIDRPSEKFLSFMNKYYGLSDIISQNNKFVVFEGFFDDEEQETKGNRYSQSAKYSDRSSCYSSSSENGRSLNGSSQSASVLPRSAFGRYAAARPPCSMATIIHNTAVLGQSAERASEISDIRRGLQTPNNSKLERPRSLSLYSEEEQKNRNHELSTAPTPALPDDEPLPSVPQTPAIPDEPEVPEVPLIPEPEEEPVQENAEPEIVEKTRENSVKSSPSCGQEVAGTTQAGHLDLKFYHSPLW
ncbi:alpha-tubulin N-acetyltransferase-like [Leptopilina heterotoma]|uniref:alpha-tubulin N-acetyltransferase-like n=1 Tax=Leptopilina heterotoma TaxID=63436 RepID=UPI001CA80B2B|nr:alpha-tubulin N-acetyltransferase-like [Leptopilina heterotoma]XP_043465067.1 alpha-tubulin N-acetyltransferase-like [Leptopilina heterotoma]XP_043465068.1 alpha-tubulin N-acetyltransferase-like [Leptopilina heterotoma]